MRPRGSLVARARVAADLKANRRPQGMQPDEAAVYDFCMELSTRHEVSDEVFQRARAIFSEQQLADLIVLGLGVRVLLGAVQRGRQRPSAGTGTAPPGG